MTTSARRSDSAFQKAIELYYEFALGDFFAELADHLHTGCVYVRPALFAMAKSVVLEDGRPAWFVTAAVGDLTRLMDILPWDLPYIAFRRRGTDKIRVYSFDRFNRLVAVKLKLMKELPNEIL